MKSMSCPLYKKPLKSDYFALQLLVGLLGVLQGGQCGGLLLGHLLHDLHGVACRLRGLDTRRHSERGGRLPGRLRPGLCAEGTTQTGGAGLTATRELETGRVSAPDHHTRSSGRVETGRLPHAPCTDLGPQRQAHATGTALPALLAHGREKRSVATEGNALVRLNFSLPPTHRQGA